jgi:hypothetical protein
MLIVKDIEPVLSKDTAHDDRLFETANLRQKTTGLPMVIWVSEKGHTKHGPRVKVSITHSHKADISNTVSISIGDEPDIVAGTGLSYHDIELIRKYIKLNKEALLDYWYGNIDTAELIEKLVKLE